MTSFDKVKLDNIESNAQRNPTGIPNINNSTSQYLRGDGKWITPPDTNTTYEQMTGATTSASGSMGLVPAPTAGQANRYLRSDGSWQVPPNTTYGLATSSTNGLISSSDKVKLDGLPNGSNIPILATSVVNLYVATNGVDAIGRGLSISTPFKTIQFAINYAKRYNLAYSDDPQVIIWLASGTYNEELCCNTNPNVRIAIDGGTANPLITGSVCCYDYAFLYLHNLRLQNNFQKSTQAVNIWEYCSLIIDNCTFLAGTGTRPEWTLLLTVGGKSSIHISNCTFSNINYHCVFNGLQNSCFYVTGTIKYTGTCYGIHNIHLQDYSQIQLYDATFSGTFTGTKYYLYRHSSLSNNNRGDSILPGTEAGTVLSGSFVE